jgi:hypothetical protein
VVRLLNHQIKSLGSTLVGLTSQTIYHAGVLPSGCDPVPSDFFWQPSQPSSNAILSFFADGCGRFYVMVVNRTLTETSTLSFAIHPAPTSLTEVSKDSGQEIGTTYVASTGTVSAQYAPGEGRLYALPANYASGFARYDAHVQDIGWMEPVYNGGTAGTVGLAKRLEAVRLDLVNAPAGTHAKVRVFVSTLGWGDWVSEGAIAGSTGQGLAMEGVEIALEGAPPGWHVRYRAHVSTVGWQAWVKDGATAGVVGQSLPMEALEIVVYSE